MNTVPYDPRVFELLRCESDAIAQRYLDRTSGVPTLPPQPVPRQPSLDPISDAIRDHYLAQARAADQVRRIKRGAEWVQALEAFDEDDGV